MEFMAPLQKIYDEHVKHNFRKDKHRRGSWWRMRKYLKKENAPYLTITKDYEFENFYEEYHDDNYGEYVPKMKLVP